MQPLAAMTKLESVPRMPVWGVAWLMVIVAGCSDARPVVDGTPQCTTWTEVKPILDAKCVSCHGAESPRGGWNATTYLSAIGVPAPEASFLADTAPSGVVTAGDPSSRLLSVLTPSSSVPEHRATADVLDTLSHWVVDCKLSFANSKVHAGGLLNPADPSFHGKLLQARGWNFGLCAKCHGEDFEGGAAKVSCTQCHKRGPTDCTTCHSNITHDGNHGAHLTGPTLGHEFQCKECHDVPSSWADPGHILDAQGKPIATPAKVHLGALANATPDGVTRPGPATYDPSDKSCSNVYCHGGAFTDAKAKVTTPKWTDGKEDAACGACHGTPPANHGAATQCTMCHGDVVDSQQHLVKLDEHITGTIRLEPGITSPDCTACHGGDAGNPAPPRDLSGNTATTALGVGAHQAHLNPPNGLTAPIACGDCHAVPAKVLSDGHIVTGTPPSVFPASISATSKAFADGASPQWDESTATCSNVYCHGGGQHFQADATASLDRTPKWTKVGQQQVYCGSCHGVPPADSAHTPSMGLTTCATCHPGSVDANGFPIVTGTPGHETSKHIDGVIDYVAP